MAIREVSIVHHITLVLLVLWIFSSLGWSSPALYLVSLFYLYKVNERYSLKLRKKIEFEEKKNANQQKLLSDSETVRWLNHAVERAWPICMEQIASQKFLLPIVPWFLDKYKPWSARKARIQHLYLGRSPPIFTEVRVVGESADDDHLILELGVQFVSADDMSAVLAVQLRKRLGLGIWANMHVTGMQVEGKVLAGVRFLRNWPFIERVRVCFVEPPYFQMTVKPIFGHGIDVSELPGIQGWLDKIVAVAFEQTLVEPNMLVIDMVRFASTRTDWFTVDEKNPLAFAKVEIIEAADLKPSDMNGLADPYVKGQIGAYRFRTKVQKKTLVPKWFEEFKVPICSWEAPNLLVLEVHDKDPIFDDFVGDCSVNINDLRGGERHDMWLALRNVKTGRLHLAITVHERDEKVKEPLSDDDQSNLPETSSPRSTTGDRNSSNTFGRTDKRHRVADEFEPVHIEGQDQTRVWVHRPGTSVSQSWEPRKGSSRFGETQVRSKDDECSKSSRSDKCSDANRVDKNEDGSLRAVLRKGLHKVGTLFQKSSKIEGSEGRGEKGDSLRPPNLKAIGKRGLSVKLILDEGFFDDQRMEEESSGHEVGDRESLRKGEGRGKSAHDFDNLSKNSRSSESKTTVRESSLAA